MKKFLKYSLALLVVFLGYRLVMTNFTLREDNIAMHHALVFSQVVRGDLYQGIYKVSDDIGKLELLRGKHIDRHEHVRQALQKVMINMPDRNWLHTLGLYDDPEEPMSGFVIPGVSGKYVWWRLGLNLAHMENQGSMYRTLIHEYGHMLFFKGSDGKLLTNGCTSLSTQSEADGVLAAFQKRFWDCTADTWPRYDTRKFHSRHASRFSREDLAEAFTAFVVCPKTKTSPDVEAEQKVQFFWDQPRLVDLRSKMRTSLGTDLTNEIWSQSLGFCDHWKR